MTPPRAPASQATTFAATTFAATASLLGSIVTGAVCALPLVAIVLGVGGLGWLTQYSYLRVPASIATAGLLGFAFYTQSRARRSSSCGAAAERRRRGVARWLLWLALGVALAVNLFEYVILPRLV